MCDGPSPWGKHEHAMMGATVPLLFGPVDDPRPPHPAAGAVIAAALENARRLDVQRAAAQRKGRMSRGDTDATSFKNVRDAVLSYLAGCAAKGITPNERSAHGHVAAYTGFTWRTVRDRYAREGKDAAAIVRDIIAENPF